MLALSWEMLPWRATWEVSLAQLQRSATLAAVTGSTCCDTHPHKAPTGALMLPTAVLLGIPKGGYEHPIDKKAGKLEEEVPRLICVR